MSEITQLLGKLRDGDADDFNRVLPLLYDDLRLAAHRQLRKLRPGQTLDTQGLVHEAYLKLAKQSADYQDRGHFLAVATVAMRHILVSYARRRSAKKRGGGDAMVTLREESAGADDPSLELLALNEALTSLEAAEPQLARLVELRFFAGLTVEETARVLEKSSRTVKRDWRKARAYLEAVLGAPPKEA